MLKFLKINFLVLIIIFSACSKKKQKAVEEAVNPDSYDPSYTLPSTPTSINNLTAPAQTPINQVLALAGEDVVGIKPEVNAANADTIRDTSPQKSSNRDLIRDTDDNKKKNENLAFNSPSFLNDSVQSSNNQKPIFNFQNNKLSGSENSENQNDLNTMNARSGYLPEFKSVNSKQNEKGKNTQNLFGKLGPSEQGGLSELKFDSTGAATNANIDFDELLKQVGDTSLFKRVHPHHERHYLRYH